MTTSLSVPN